MFGLILGIFTVALSNYFGIKITKNISVLVRSLLDSARMVVVWAFELAVGWSSFSWIQVLGFVFVLSGNLVYNAVVKCPCLNDYDEVQKINPSKKGKNKVKNTGG